MTPRLPYLLPLVVALVASTMPAADATGPAPLPVPPHDQGLPYTPSGAAAARAALAGRIAVFVGSRYAWVGSGRVRLDDANWRDEVIEREGVVYVPEAFAAVVLAPSPVLDAAPAYLADRWIHTVARPHATLPAGARTCRVEGRPYVALADLGRPIAQRGGLVLCGTSEVPFDGLLLENITTLFDTPESLADPAIATRHIPTLARQGTWTDLVHATPEQLAWFNGPVKSWPTAPAESYDERGLDLSLLGSPVPAPGVYPRLFFSPEDLPAVRARITSTAFGRRSLIEMEELFARSFLDPTTDDGKLFARLSAGDTAGLRWADIAPGQGANHVGDNFVGFKPTLRTSHVAYVPEHLNNLALYALLTGKEDLGQRAATAIATYYQLREPLVDLHNATSDSEFGSGIRNGDLGAATAWRGMHAIVPNMNLGMALDFGGRWMTDAQRDLMRRVIAKATYGRRAYGQDATARFHDVNWVTWDLPQYLALAAIEGLEGCDPEGLDSHRRTLRNFCDWGIDDQGVLFETNGKAAGGLQSFFQALVVAGRRGERLYGHPHLRRLMTAQVQMTSPNGRVTVTSGTQYVPYSGSSLTLQFVNEWHTLFPQDRAPAYLLSQADMVGNASGVWLGSDRPEAELRATARADQRLRMPSFSNPGFTRGLLFDSPWPTTTRADLGLPLDFVAPTHGVLASRSDDTPDATWACLMVRPNHYMGAGHHHADHGMIHVSALGIDWLTESRFTGTWDGLYASLVQIDGHSQAETIPGVINGYPAAPTWLGAVTGPGGAAASADLTAAYSWRWTNQPPKVWPAEVRALPWELEPSQRILDIYAGMGRHKLRPWWAQYTFSNFTPTLRAPFNPMEYIHRRLAVVRGAHPYVAVLDEARKDGQPHRYDWTSPVAGGVWRAEVPGLAANQIALARRPLEDKAAGTDRSAIVPVAGEPLLLVTAVGLPTEPAAKPRVVMDIAPGPTTRDGKPQTFERLTIGQTAIEARFLVVMTPLRTGQASPAIAWDAAAGIATVTWPDQQDRLALVAGTDGRSRLLISRGGTPVVATP